LLYRIVKLTDETKSALASLKVFDFKIIAFFRGETVFAAVFDRLESLRDFSTQPDRHVKIEQFFVALDVSTCNLLS